VDSGQMHGSTYIVNKQCMLIVNKHRVYRYRLNIHKHAICMMSGTERSHRSAIYNKMNEFKLLSKIAVSIRGLQ